MTRSPDLRTSSNRVRYETTSPPVLALIRTSAKLAPGIMRSKAAANANRGTESSLLVSGLRESDQAQDTEEICKKVQRNDDGRRLLARPADEGGLFPSLTEI